jgi:hypothetical protein
MPQSYDHRTAHWDASILGITLDEWAKMDPEERSVYIVDSLHRAGDLASEIVRAFQADLNGSERAAILKASRVLQSIARSRG